MIVVQLTNRMNCNVDMCAVCFLQKERKSRKSESPTVLRMWSQSAWLAPNRLPEVSLFDFGESSDHDARLGILRRRPRQRSTCMRVILAEKDGSHPRT